MEILGTNEGLTDESGADHAIAASNEAPFSLSRKRDSAEDEEDGGEYDAAENDEDGRQPQSGQRCAQLCAFGLMTVLIHVIIILRAYDAGLKRPENIEHE